MVLCDCRCGWVVAMPGCKDPAAGWFAWIRLCSGPFHPTIGNARGLRGQPLDEEQNFSGVIVVKGGIIRKGCITRAVANFD